MAELRWHPLTKDWVMVASHRQNRPQMPKDWCPFCPGPDNDKVPASFDVLKYDNDFPALSQNPPEMDDVATSIYKTAPSYGKCEVVLYSPEHTVTLPELSESHVRKLVDLWTERFDELSQDEKIKYIFIFENRGDVVGVTMPHPHGQIYGYSFIPKKLELELSSSKEHFEETGKCLFCDMLNDEVKDGRRVIFENEDISDEIIKEYEESFLEAINDDLNMPVAMSVVWDVIKNPVKSKKLQNLLLKFDEVLGLDLKHYKKQDNVLPEEIKELIKERNKARTDKNWAESDRIRDILIEKGYIVKDSKEGTIVEKQ